MILTCPREGCGRRRSSPCASTCYLVSATHYAEIIREAQRDADRHAYAEARNAERIADARRELGYADPDRGDNEQAPAPD
ncbi:hypothetical protein SEA_VANLEE_117 [Gordonia phage VanLee]|uniref:Uncharacterized protein n=1 Tax=Gordonia phage VanLee TaxID=2845816 RepID=A0A8F2IF94_9CAUD|nr:hypothetical protein QEH49_gp117 [Gordonia phage VanLee]QWS68234.1 hypothetical protein SEA_VANLEE_117 [Gordonia phage VanLee]